MPPVSAHYKDAARSQGNVNGVSTMLSGWLLTHTARQQSDRHCSSIYSLVTVQSPPDGASAGLETANTGCCLPVAGCHVTFQPQGQKNAKKTKTRVSLNKSLQGRMFGSESLCRTEATEKSGGSQDGRNDGQPAKKGDMKNK